MRRSWSARSAICATVDTARLRICGAGCVRHAFGGSARRLRPQESAPVTNPAPAASPAASPDPAALLRSRSYLVLLVFGAIVGVPVAAVAYFFLEGVAELQQYLFDTLPGDLGFDSQPAWWPIPLLALSGVLVALTIRYLPGIGGHKPAEGFKASGPVPPIELPGIVIAAFATLSLGVVLGPGGAADRDRQRPRRPRRPPRQARRAADGQRRDRRRRELRRDQHAARLAASGRVPDDGGRRDRRRDARRGARARAARRRRRLADLRRPRQLDRLRHLLARGPEHPSGRQPRRAPSSCGRS